MRKIFATVAALLFSTVLARADNLGGFDNGVKFFPVVQNAAYSTGQSLGGLQTVSVFRTTGVPAFIFNAFQLTSIGGSTVATTVYTYDTLPTGTCTDRVAFAESNSDIANRFMAPFVLTPAVVGAGSTTTTAQLLQIVSGQNHDTVLKTNLYVCIVANGAVTPASTTDLIGKISGAQD